MAASLRYIVRVIRGQEPVPSLRPFGENVIAHPICDQEDRPRILDMFRFDDLLYFLLDDVEEGASSSVNLQTLKIRLHHRRIKTEKSDIEFLFIEGSGR